MLGRLIRLSPLRFLGAPQKEADEFLSGREERFHNHNLVNLFGVDYTIFQLDDPSRQWWRGYLNFNLASSLRMTWVMFWKAFLEKYMPWSMYVYLKDKFSGLEQGSIIVDVYKAWFPELSRHTTMILPTKHEKE